MIIIRYIDAFLCSTSMAPRNGVMFNQMFSITLFGKRFYQSQMLSDTTNS